MKFVRCTIIFLFIDLIRCIIIILIILILGYILIIHLNFLVINQKGFNLFFVIVINSIFKFVFNCLVNNIFWRYLKLIFDLKFIYIFFLFFLDDSFSSLSEFSSSFNSELSILATNNEALPPSLSIFGYDPENTLK